MADPNLIFWSLKILFFPGGVARTFQWPQPQQQQQQQQQQRRFKNFGRKDEIKNAAAETAITGHSR